MIQTPRLLPTIGAHMPGASSALCQFLLEARHASPVCQELPIKAGPIIANANDLITERVQRQLRLDVGEA